MKQKTYQILMTVFVCVGLLSLIALTVYTIIAYRNASILNFIAEELW